MLVLRFVLEFFLTQNGKNMYSLHFPLQPNKESGWTISTAYLKQIVSHIAENSVSWEDIETVLLALEQMHDPAHDSDCASHNSPAYPNGLCDCSRMRIGAFEN
jgi:hypothetical protein